MSANGKRVAPYGEIVAGLVASTMAAMAESLDDLTNFAERGDLAEGDQSKINRHFSWVCVHYPEGVNRHLFDGVLPNYPLRTKGLRHRSRIDPAIADALRRAAPIPHDVPDFSEYVRGEPTRISSLIRRASIDAIAGRRRSVGYAQDNEKPRKREKFITIPSPLKIVHDYLTMPKHPGSQAYSLLSMRNFLFEIFQTIPDEIGESSGFEQFNVQEVESALSSIYTSTRERFWSTGQDKLPGHGRTPVDSLLRHFLAMKGILNLRFHNIQDCRKYLDSGSVHTNVVRYEFERSAYLDRLPDVGELVNELWGLPLPLRGADTIFRGGLKFAARKGLVCALHGGPGSGKTSLSLGIGAALSGFGIRTVFFTAEETADDLYRRTNGLLSDDVRRLSFVPKRPEDWLQIVRFKMPTQRSDNLISHLKASFHGIAAAIQDRARVDQDQLRNGPPSPCNAVIVLDGLHDLAARAMADDDSRSSRDSVYHLHQFIEVCRELQALVILTTGTDWTADKSLDYLVDVALRLTHETESESGAKPDRILTLTKARHQLCSPGSHGLQIAGQKGVRFTPQMNYQLDRQAIWATRLPDQYVYKKVMQLATDQRFLHLFPSEPERPIGNGGTFDVVPGGVRIFKGSNIFINGEGSGGKAALALKLAIAPSFDARKDDRLISRPDRVLVVSFLYPDEYYRNIFERIVKLQSREYTNLPKGWEPRLEVFQLYPGHLKPGVLFDRIEWHLQEADLMGDPVTAVIIDGMHNVFLQFPEIERQNLFWPQLFSMLRTRDVSIVSTHAVLTYGSFVSSPTNQKLDDRRSDPLRHALVQKTDFRFEVEPRDLSVSRRNPKVTEPNSFVIRTLSAIGQPLPNRGDELCWSRERLVLFSAAQRPLPFEASTER